MVYNRGPFGDPSPQQFTVVRSTSEWGPPVQRTYEIDWEVYSVILILSDVIMTVAWHIVPVPSAAVCIAAAGAGTN